MLSGGAANAAAESKHPYCTSAASLENPFTIEVSFSVVVSPVLPSLLFTVILSGPALAAKDLTMQSAAAAR